MTVRVRFAPSPTGFLHVGGARTALLNLLFARKHQGVFVLRIEDTDRSRERPEFRDEIFRALQWLGIEEDEGPQKGGLYGPYVQSERGEMYATALARLEAQNAVYPCFCVSTTNEGPAESFGETVHAQPRCQCEELSADERSNRTAALGTKPAMRMRVDQQIVHRVQDMIRGEVFFPAGEVENFIVSKVGGAPLYNFAAVVDDAAMAITHIIRGEEHLANTPKQILIYQALGYTMPQFAHLPIILNTERRKLSKRDGATAVSEYENAGFLPESLRNFLALLGWSPGGDREIMSMDEMIDAFDIARVQKHGAVFDVVKLTWMNGEYLRTTPIADLVPIAAKLLAHRSDAALLRTDEAHIRAVCELLHQRAKTVADIVGQTYLFSRETKLAWDAEAVSKRVPDAAARQRLAQLMEVFAKVQRFERVELETALRDLALRSETKAGEYIGPLRVAITGSAVSPGIFELCEVLGHDIVLGRMAAFLQEFSLEVGTP